MKKAKIGLLPLYIKLYDDFSDPQRRVLIEEFYSKIAALLEDKGLEVVTSSVCRLHDEFAKAVKSFEDADVDALVTLHLAYSPSLESADILANTKLPIVVFDTTPDYEFNYSTNSDKIGTNHGIHGVQDMCNLLKRNKKDFVICVGHVEHSDVVDDVVAAVYGAKMSKTMKNAKVGCAVKSFDGMGDFCVPYDELKSSIGMDVVTLDPNNMPAVTEAEIKAEFDADCAKYDISNVTYEQYKDSHRVALSIRKWIDENKLTAFTMNFLSTKAGTGFDCIPFTEACKQMAKGVGYAGEGDVLTAAFVSSLMSVYAETTFAEMFCPDWAGNTIYISHMGEYNPLCTTEKPRFKVNNFPYTDAKNPSVFYSPFNAGKAIFACLAPDADGKFTLIASSIEMLHTPVGTTFDNEVSGWFKPQSTIDKFLSDYSMNGGIHHASIIYGGDMKSLKAYAKFMNWSFVTI